MKLLTILLVIVISINASGQQLTYKGEIVDTLKIISNSSFYHFDTLGTTTGVYDEYIIIFNKEKKSYILNPYKRTEYKFSFEPDTSFRKEKILKQGIVIDRLLISNLLKQFEITYIKPNFNNIGMTNEEFFNLTDKKHIIQVAKWHKTDWQFKNSHITKEQNENIFNGCQNTDTLNLYLETCFSKSGYVVVTDVDDHFDVIISTTNANYCFEGQYPNAFKQPWYGHSDSGSFAKTTLLNFSINNALVELLPGNFSRLETLKFEALCNEYIEWYLKRRGIIF